MTIILIEPECVTFFLRFHKVPLHPQTCHFSNSVEALTLETKMLLRSGALCKSRTVRFRGLCDEVKLQFFFEQLHWIPRRPAGSSFASTVSSVFGALVLVITRSVVFEELLGELVSLIVSVFVG